MLWYCLYDTCGETDRNEMYILSACVSQKVTTHFYSISFTHPFYLLHIWCKRESNVVVAMKRKREERVTHSTAQHSTIFPSEKTQGKLYLFKAYTQIPSSSSACAEADLLRKRSEKKKSNGLCRNRRIPFNIDFVTLFDDSAVWRFSWNNTPPAKRFTSFGLMFLKNHWEEKRWSSFWRIQSNGFTKFILEIA